MSPVDVLHVLPDLAPGGAERMAVQLMLDTQRHFAVGALVLGRARGTTLEGELARAGVPTWFLGKRAGAQPTLWPSVGRMLTQCRPLLLHTHRHVLPYLLPFLARRQLRCVHTTHITAPHELTRAGRWLQRAGYAMGVVPVAVSEAVRTSIAQTYGRDDVMLIPNGVPTARFARSAGLRARLRATLGLADDAVVLASVARLAPSKDPALLLRAFAHGAADLGAHLLLAGDGPLRAPLETLARRLGITDRVHFLGARDDVHAVLAGADVFALASKREGSPLAVLEAMSAGLPVVASAVGGVAEVVRDEQTGFVVPAGEPTRFGMALRRLVRDAALRLRMGRLGRDRVRRCYDSALMTRRYERLYEQVLEGGSALSESRA